MEKTEQSETKIRILAIDTSSSVASVAIMDNKMLMGEYSINSKKKHSKILMPMIMELMNNLDICPEDIDIYAASNGPGSFTGLRIGITVIKAMAYAIKKPVVAVPSLEALAYNLPLWEGHICPIMDARNNQVFTALYKWDGSTLKDITGSMAIPIQELIELIKIYKTRTVFVGDGVMIHRQYISEQLGKDAAFAPSNLIFTRAGSVAQAAADRALRGDVTTSFELKPFYLRKSQAERELEKNNKGESREG